VGAPVPDGLRDRPRTAESARDELAALFSVLRQAGDGHLLADERPTVFVSGHFGNFELSSFMMGLFGFPTYAIARRLDNPYLDRFVNQFRSTHGQFILPKDGSAAQVDAVLRAGGVIGLLGDQSAGRRELGSIFWDARPRATRPSPCSPCERSAAGRGLRQTEWRAFGI